jgi:methyltransferase
MSDPGPAAVPVLGLALFLAYHAAERGFELVMSARHVRRLLARGAREYGREHFPALVVMHALFPVALIAEVLLLGARPARLAPLWIALFAAAQLLRFACMRALGERWTTRVIVLEGAPLVHSGPYRWLRHPNYLAVATELLSAPLMFGAWRTAAVFTVANAFALRVRIRCEERALAADAGQGGRARPPRPVSG